MEENGCNQLYMKIPWYNVEFVRVMSTMQRTAQKRRGGMKKGEKHL